MTCFPFTCKQCNATGVVDRLKPFIMYNILSCEVLLMLVFTEFVMLNWRMCICGREYASVLWSVMCVFVYACAFLRLCLVICVSLGTYFFVGVYVSVHIHYFFFFNVRACMSVYDCVHALPRPCVCVSPGDPDKKNDVYQTSHEIPINTRNINSFLLLAHQPKNTHTNEDVVVSCNAASVPLAPRREHLWSWNSYKPRGAHVSGAASAHATSHARQPTAQPRGIDRMGVIAVLRSLFLFAF